MTNMIKPFPNKKQGSVLELAERLMREAEITPEIKPDALETSPKPTRKPKPSPIINPISADIIKSDYVQVPNEDFIIAIAETDKGLNYYNANKVVMQRGLFVPDVREFMSFHNHVIDAYKNKKTILGADGNPISDKTKKDLYRQLTEDCWTWLNGKFIIKDSKRALEKIIGLDSKGKLITNEEPLEDCLMSDSYVYFTKLNGQGFPNISSKYSKQDYQKGKNIYFYFPRDGAVAGFGAYSGGADLDCSGYPSSSYGSLGVRAVRRDVSKARKHLINGGGSK